MRFQLLDRITELHAGQSITAVKTLLPSEEYLKDHFPNFPVMPGVLMLEALYQAGAWLLRKSDEFQRPLIVLKQAKNIKFQGFVEPGQTLTVTASVVKKNETTVTLKGEGTVDGRAAVNGRLVLESFKVSERVPDEKHTDCFAEKSYRELFAALTS